MFQNHEASHRTALGGSRGHTPCAKTNQDRPISKLRLDFMGAYNTNVNSELASIKVIVY